ncbi:hypothetical protein [Sediminitomix flava]|uniref:Lipoprotein n=1 Tax=Sediminitomix flava TaxID=379075 RepID=A0A315Z5J1_SEDFL|nr:hypothetical protein [Sediminitomix flava]PWJ38022.1 hypothetical protein BC781_108157 [Sediminitomix flava]
MKTVKKISIGLLLGLGFFTSCYQEGFEEEFEQMDETAYMASDSSYMINELELYNGNTTTNDDDTDPLKDKPKGN